MDPKVRYTKAGDFNIAYQTVGDGPIDVVFSPGWVTHLELAWDIPALARFYEKLASFSRLILFDKRGIGLSDRVSPNDMPTLEQRAGDIRAVMDATGSKQAVLFGTLGGGAMCGLFAASYPERTKGLVLYATWIKAPRETGVLARLADTVEGSLERIEREWGRESVAVAPWAPSLLEDDATADAYLRLARASVSPASARLMMAVGYQVDWEATLPAVRVPTLVLHRSGDLVVSVDEGRRLARSITGARYVELPGVDHLVWVGDQDVVVDEVRAFVEGLSAETRSDRMLATIMFTDVAGSTEMAVRLGDAAWRELLMEHHRVVRRELEVGRGVEVETAGDSFLATFDAPARAVRCARSIVEATSAIGIDVRAGLHTGECEVTAEGIRGIAVHVAARVAGLAYPREVLVTNTVRDLASGSGIGFADRGAHALKGVPNTWRLFAADYRG
jgi:class 3 adenylate cyclase